MTDTGPELPDGWVQKPVADVLSSLDLKCVVQEGELVASAIVLIKLITPDGDVALREVSNGVDWITKIGMLQQCANDAAETTQVGHIVSAIYRGEEG